jgi:hypothetical protein
MAPETLTTDYSNLFSGQISLRVLVGKALALAAGKRAAAEEKWRYTG